MQTVTATARCEYCAWAVKFSGDTALEVATFLRKKLLEHVEARHPDKVAAPSVVTEGKP